MHALFSRGGPLMWPLLACSILSVAIVIERAIFWLRERRSRDRQAVDEIIARTERGEFECAISRGREAGDAAARVLTQGLLHRDHGLAEGMEMAAENQIARMKRGLSVLDTIITLAPLLGILGTVLGIIESFDMLGQAGLEDPRAVTGGIAQALITTAAGLSVAIVTLIPYNYLVHAVQRVTLELENLTTSLEVAYRKGVERRDAAA